MGYYMYFDTGTINQKYVLIFVDVIVDSHRVINKKYTKTAFSKCKKSEIFKVSVYSCYPVWKSDRWLQIVLGV